MSSSTTQQRRLPLLSVLGTTGLLLLSVLFLTAWLGAATVHGAQADLSWDPPVNSDGTPVSNLGGYKVYRGTTSRNYSQSFTTGTTTNYTDSSVADGTTYYYTVTAVDTAGNESGTSNEVSKIIPGTAPTGTQSPTVAQSGWKLLYVDSQELVGDPGAAINAFDGNPDTFWHTQWLNGSPPCPHEIQIDLGQAYDLDSFSYLPRQHVYENGRIASFEFYVSNGADWGTPVATGTFLNDLTKKTVSFPKKTGRYIRLRALSEVNGNPWTNAGEINVTGTPNTSTPTNPASTFTITATAGTGGTITASGATGSTVTVNQGASQGFTITPGSGYSIADVKVDGATVGAVSSYTFANVTANHTISATFAVMTHTITASAGTGGSISPTGTATVNHNGSQAYTITPASGYKVSDVKVDGTSVGAVGTYSFSSVTANRTIQATFAATTSAAIPKTGWRLAYVDSQETTGENGAATNAFDGQSGTFWHTAWSSGNAPYPHEIRIDLGKIYAVDSFSYLPRQDGSANGRIARYEFYVGDGTNWGTAVATGTFANSATKKTVSFAKKSGRYIRLRALSEVNGQPWTSAAEIGVTGQ